ncbi:MAG: cobalamin-dependent protein [Candidatus Micrarchaeota archaeon]
MNAARFIEKQSASGRPQFGHFASGHLLVPDHINRSRIDVGTAPNVNGNSNKEKRIVLIKPPLYTCSTFSPIRSAQPLGIWQLGSFLSSRGFEVRVVDSVIEGWGNKRRIGSSELFDFPSHMKEKWAYLRTHSPREFLATYPVVDGSGGIRRSIIRTGLSDEQIVERVREFDPAWIGISIIATCEHRGAMELAKRLRSEFPESKILAGGSHATDMARLVMDDSGGAIDFIVKGAGELATELLMRGVLSERGIAYKDGNRIIEEADSPPTPLEILPPLDPGLLSHVNYPILAPHSYGTHGRKYTDYMFSFGCHKGCDFCRQGSVRDGYRHLSLEQVRAQLRIFRDHGIEELVLQDDSLLGGPRNDGKEFFLQVVRLLKESGIFWHDNGGVEFERLDERIVDSILESNCSPGDSRCTALYVPFNPRHLDQRRVVEHHMAKRPDQLALLRKLRENGIYTFTSGIWGHVNQDAADMESDIQGYEELLKSGIVDQVIVFGLSYLPRTRDWDFRHLIADPYDWEGFSIFTPHAGTMNATLDEVNLMVLEAYKRLNPLQMHAEPWASGIPPNVPEGWR